MNNKSMEHQTHMRQPAEWPELLDIATDLASRRLKSDEHKMTKMLQRVREVDIEEREQNRYYSLSVATCEWAKAAHDSDIRAKALHQHSEKIVENHRDYCDRNGYEVQDGLRVASCTRTYTGVSTEHLPEQAVAGLSPGMQLLGNALQLSRSRHHDDDIPKIARSGRDFRGQEPLVGALTQFTTGASYILGARIRNMVARGDAKDFYSAQAGAVLLRDVISPQDIMDLDVLKPANFAAALRIDEFAANKWLTLNADGTISADHTLLAAPPGPPGDGILHAARLRCPALYVPGAISVALTFVKEAVCQAEEKAIEPLYRRR